MLIDLEPKQYYHLFPNDPHPFLTRGFVGLNSVKAEKILHLTTESKKPGMGIIFGLKEGWLLSPFSAPFGGFHFRKEVMYISEMENFLVELKDFIRSNDYHGIKIVFPPDIYHQTFNAKLVKAFYSQNYVCEPLEITNWVDLQLFGEKFTQKNSKEYYKQALGNELKFYKVEGNTDFQEIYDLIHQNRKRFGRPIYMTLQDILKTGDLWPVDYFKVTSREDKVIAAAIIYRSHPKISYALFWGDNDEGRPLRAMDFLSFRLWSYYKKLGYSYMDLGVSTESGNPNEGLLRFKESHEAVSSLRYSFSFQNKQT